MLILKLLAVSIRKNINLKKTKYKINLIPVKHKTKMKHVFCNNIKDE